MNKGEKFAIVLMIKTPDSVHPMAIEYKADESTRNVDLSDGEGYISTNGKNWENVEETQSANLCIKSICKRKVSQSGMEEKVIKAATVIITAISIIVAGTLLFFPQLHIRARGKQGTSGTGKPSSARKIWMRWKCCSIIRQM